MQSSIDRKESALHIFYGAKTSDLFPKLSRVQCRSVLLEALRTVPSLLPRRKRIVLSIYWTDDEEIRALNVSYRQKDAPTNILSFCLSNIEPQKNGRINLGELIMSRETAIREAEEKGWSEASYFLHLLVHGFVHLLGYDHENPEEACIMEALESKVLKNCGLPDPYVI